MEQSVTTDEESPLLKDSSAISYNQSPVVVQGVGEPLDEHEHFHATIFKRRWWILFAFCCCGLTQSTLWNTWSPLLDAMYIAYDWEDSFVALLPAFSDASYIICGFPFMYLVETRDLRFGMIMAAALLVFGTASWNIAIPTSQNWLVVIGSTCNGITACITMAAPPLLSVLWFPTSERTTATALSSMAGYLGTGVAFISGPYISGANVTANDVKNSANLTEDFVDNLKSGIRNVIYFDTALAVFSFIIIFAYFPAKPPKPPSKSQTKEREDFWHGMRLLLTNPQFWILNIAYNLPNGAFNAWLPLVSVNFRSLGVGEQTAGWIGFASICVGCFGSVGMSMVVDHFKRKMKLFLMVMACVSILIFGILACVQMHIIYVPPHLVTPVLYILCMAAALALNGVIPLYYELGCESAYPVHEGLACSFITVWNNVFGMAFFLLFLIPGLATDTRWMCWTCFGTCVVSLPLLLFLKEHFYRLDVETSSISDNGEESINTQQSDITPHDL